MSQTPGRNDPCHCGSGLKYKKCHATLDREAAGSPRLRLLNNAPEPARRRLLTLPPAANLSREWEVEIAPVPGRFDNNPDARPAVVLVVAPPFVLASDIVDHPSAEPDELAALLARAVLTAVENSAVTPAHVAIRHQTLVAPLSRLLLVHNIGVLLQTDLPGVNDALRSLLGHVFGGIAPLESLRSQPETWAGWGMPHALVTRMFAVAANYYRAAPWKLSPFEQPILISRSGGHEWAAVVLGAAGTQLGLTLYHDPVDLDRMHEASEDNPAVAMGGIRGTVLALLFNTRSELPKRMREEIKTARWDIAAPDAYPTLTVLNTPGGGVQQRCFEDLIAAGISVPRFVQAFAPLFAGEFSDETEVSWTDPETDVCCRLELLDDELPDVWSKYDVLSLAGPQGSGATPVASVDETSAKKSVTRTLTRFRAWLRKPAQGKAPSDVAVQKHAEVARFFVELCAFGRGKPASAVTEYDLREFLYDWYPRKVGGTARSARAALGSLEKFFEFLAEREHVHCPWAWPILADFDTFMERRRTFPGGLFWDSAVQEWQADNAFELMARLLVPVSDPTGELVWSDTMGMVEHTLLNEAHQLWLSWRDEAVRSGITAPRDILQLAMVRQREWAATPNGRCEGLTPKVAIAQERAAFPHRPLD